MIRRTTIELDDELLAKARAVLGQSTVRATVEEPRQPDVTTRTHGIASSSTAPLTLWPMRGAGTMLRLMSTCYAARARCQGDMDRIRSSILHHPRLK